MRWYAQNAGRISSGEPLIWKISSCYYNQPSHHTRRKSFRVFWWINLQSLHWYILENNIMQFLKHASRQVLLILTSGVSEHWALNTLNTEHTEHWTLNTLSSEHHLFQIANESGGGGLFFSWYKCKWKYKSTKTSGILWEKKRNIVKHCERKLEKYCRILKRCSEFIAKYCKDAVKYCAFLPLQGQIKKCKNDTNAMLSNVYHCLCISNCCVSM